MKTHYQPKFTDKFISDNPEFFSFFVYQNKDNAIEDFPNDEIIEYNEGDIEQPVVIDIEDVPEVYEKGLLHFILMYLPFYGLYYVIKHYDGKFIKSKHHNATAIAQAVYVTILALAFYYFILFNI